MNTSITTPEEPLKDPYAHKFLSDLATWLCDGYAVTVRYISFKLPDDRTRLVAGAIYCNPLPHQRDNSFSCETETILAGQQQLDSLTKANLVKMLKQAIQGEIVAFTKKHQLVGAEGNSCYSDLPTKDVWFSELNLTAFGEHYAPPGVIERARMNTQLRCAEQAFDGFEDLCSRLGFQEATRGESRPYIRLVIYPPIDLMIENTKLSNNRLVVVFRAHTNFALGALSFAVRAFPGDDLHAQSQMKDRLVWTDESPTIRKGVANVPLTSANSALVMLMIGDTTFRRQWFLDIEKASNDRLVAVQHFDRDLKMIKQAVLEVSDSSRFESGIAALLFIMGFSPAVQLETNAPDLILTTPAGRLLIVECTIRIADFSAKIGKLVDRQNSLSRAMQSSGHGTPIVAALICALPRNQIATTDDELKRHKVLLLTRESIEEAIRRVAGRQEPDSLVDEAIASFARSTSD